MFAGLTREFVDVKALPESVGRVVTLSEFRAGLCHIERPAKPPGLIAAATGQKGYSSGSPYRRWTDARRHEVGPMAVELARANVKPKPWGILDLRPWSTALHDDGAIGEIWYERPVKTPSEPSLLLKLLFTKQPLSIQVHPDDTFAHAMGLPNGKTEAWYILSATPDAKVAIGLLAAPHVAATARGH